MNNEIAIARTSKRLRKIQNEISSLLHKADRNSPYHFTLRTDDNLLLGTANLLQTLRSVKPVPRTSRKYTLEEDVAYYPAIEAIIIHVSGAATSDDHNQYSRSMEDAYLSAENYIGSLRKMRHAVPRQRPGRHCAGKTHGF